MFGGIKVNRTNTEFLWSVRTCPVTFLRTDVVGYAVAPFKTSRRRRQWLLVDVNPVLQRDTCNAIASQARSVPGLQVVS